MECDRLAVMLCGITVSLLFRLFFAWTITVFKGSSLCCVAPHVSFVVQATEAIHGV